MTASGFVTTPDCTRRWQTAAIRGRPISKVSRRPGSHHTNRYEGQEIEARLLSPMSIRGPRRLPENLRTRTLVRELAYDADRQTRSRIFVNACGVTPAVLPRCRRD